MSKLKENITSLNEKQKEAVLTTEGPLLIAAGAGSGKTRVLTHRMAYLIEFKHVNPWNILAITFTNKAANEMRERVLQLVGEQANDIWVSTFHSMCARILRREAALIGYDANFSIVAQNDQQTLLKQIIKAMNLDPNQYSPRTALSMIDQWKNTGISPDTTYEETANGIEEKYAEIYERYERRLKQSNSMDFNDLLLKTVELLEENESVRQFYQRKFQFIHVDEYQDTNYPQYQLVRLLSGRLSNVCVVGDADQSIYGWRGANMENILNFERDYPDAKVILLEQNYRSTPTILKAANSVIKNNSERQEKTLWSNRESGENIKHFYLKNDAEEAQCIVQEIEKLTKEKDLRFEDIAILYRTQAQSQRVETTLLSANIPYRVVGSVKFYSRMEIQDTLAYLKLIDNPYDDLSFLRIINVPKRGIGATTIDKLQAFASEHDFSLFESLNHLNDSSLSKGAQKKLNEFKEMINVLQKQSEFLTMTELIEQVWEQTGYRRVLETSPKIESETRLENLDEFLSVSAQFDQRDKDEFIDNDPDFQIANQLASNANPELSRLTHFLNEISLVSSSEETTDDNQITLMTLHASKGLEFPVVFLVGMEDGLFPLKRAMDDLKELEEERRLAYVGMTRAEDLLYLISVRERLLYGRYQVNQVSQFVNEIDEDLIDFQTTVPQYTSTTFNKVPKRNIASKVLLPTKGKLNKTHKKQVNQNDLREGDKVEHKMWGEGTVVSIKKENQNDNEQLITIAFPSQGIKQLLMPYAPIRKV